MANRFGAKNKAASPAASLKPVVEFASDDALGARGTHRLAANVADRALHALATLLVGFTRRAGQVLRALLQRIAASSPLMGANNTPRPTPSPNPNRNAFITILLENSTVRR
jgi:hypothetical protein